MTELEENSGGRQTPPSHLRNLLFSQKVSSVSKSQNRIYAAGLGAVKGLLGNGRKKNTKQITTESQIEVFSLM